MGKIWNSDIFLGSKICADSDCSHEIKRHLLLRRKAVTNLAAAAKSLQSCPAGASRQSRSGPENVHGAAEKENYSKRILQQRWGQEVQTCLQEGMQSDHDFIQHLIFIQESVRTTRQLTFFLGWPIHLTNSYKKSWEHGDGTLLLFLTPDNISLCMRSLPRTPGVCSK